MPCPATIYTGTRYPDGERIVVDVDGRALMTSSITPVDWGPHADREGRRALGRVLLFHEGIDYHLLGAGVADDAFAVGLASFFPRDGFTITGDQLRAWYYRYLTMGRFADA